MVKKLLLRKIVLVSCSLILLAACSRKTGSVTVTPPPPPPPPQPVVYSFESTPVWQDEFDYTGLPDAAKWGYDIGGHGWGNNELQHYTNSINNAKVEDGKLTITT